MARDVLGRVVGAVAVAASVLALLWAGPSARRHPDAAHQRAADELRPVPAGSADPPTGAPAGASSGRSVPPDAGPPTGSRRPRRPPPVSTGRYVRDLLRDPSAHADTMSAHGCADARSGSRLVLLEMGTQTVTAPRSARDPGVLLTGTYVRLSYAQVRRALAAYLAAFARCAAAPGARIAVGTNTDGVAERSDRDYYPYARRGADWYHQVIAPLDAVAQRLGLRVVGALDLEIGFAGSLAQATEWERSYLAASPTAHLVQNGSLDACPAHRTPRPRDCGAVRDQWGRVKRWSFADYVELTYGLAPGRIEALPQIYTRKDAGKWAMLDRHAGGRLIFAGALTERASCPTAWSDGCGGAASLRPRAAWAALTAALAPVNAACTVPALVDLRVDPLPRRLRHRPRANPRGPARRAVPGHRTGRRLAGSPGVP